jgi:putative Ca2+/H+ antiporter (TMEM165/GDT1 family)
MKAPRSITAAFTALLQSMQLSVALGSAVDKFSKSMRVCMLLVPFLTLALWTVSSLTESKFPAGSGNYAVAGNDALVPVVTPATTDIFFFDDVSCTNTDRPRIEFLLE